MEGDSVIGGRFCTRRAITSARQIQTAKTHANTALPRQNRPPITVPPSQSGQNPQNPAVPTQPAGRFHTRRVILSPEGDNDKPINMNSKNARRHHPPDSKPPSTDSSTLPIPPKPAKSSHFHQTGRVIPSPEGDNVRQTNTTSKNAGQFHTRWVIPSPEGDTTKPHELPG